MRYVGVHVLMGSKSHENHDLLDAFHSQVPICMLTPWVGPQDCLFFLDHQSLAPKQTACCPH